MGFFDKKDCALCGGKAGRFINYKLVNGEYMCADCRNRMSDHTEDISDMTLEEVKEQIRLKEENDARYQNEFEATRVFELDGNHKLMAVDDNRAEFVLLEEKNPTIFSFDQIMDFKVDLHTKVMSQEEQKKNAGLNGLMSFFKSEEYLSRYPELPNCPAGCKIVGMYFRIRLGENPFRAGKLEIKMLQGWSGYKTEVENAYRCADEIYRCIQEYKEG
ncbi:MAG: DUF4428 domain-containing protein [Lachnospiraceae bacterium]|nr:DUF4428 domain-containing protein [Lachnospiraceae bacterium]